MQRMKSGLAGVCLLAASVAARGQHGDVEVVVENGVLVVERSGEGLYAFEGEFGEGSFPANFTDEPGFEVDDGRMQPGDLLGFNVVNGLLYWDGAQFTTVPADHRLAVSRSVFSVTVDGSTGFVSGFDFAEADAGGGIHEHLEFELQGPGAPDDLSIGAYGLWMQLTSPSYAASNDFIIMLNYGLNEDSFEDGVLTADALIPEPGTALLLSGLTGLLFVRGRSACFRVTR